MAPKDRPLLRSRTSTKVFGSELSTTGGTGLTGTGWNGHVRALKLATATIGEYYDRAQINVNSAAGNERLGVYNTATNPDVLKAETGSIASANGLNWRSLTEFAIDTTQMWLAFQVDNASNNLFYTNTGNTADKRLQTQAYGAFPNPFVQASQDQDTVNGKIGHS